MRQRVILKTPGSFSGIITADAAIRLFLRTINISAPTAGRKWPLASLTVSAGDAAENSDRSDICPTAAQNARKKNFISIPSPAQGFINSL